MKISKKKLKHIYKVLEQEEIGYLQETMSEWYPDLFVEKEVPNIHPIGTKFRTDLGECILAMVNADCFCLVDLQTGNRYSNPKKLEGVLAPKYEVDVSLLFGREITKID